MLSSSLFRQKVNERLCNFHMLTLQQCNSKKKHGHRTVKVLRCTNKTKMRQLNYQMQQSVNTKYFVVQTFCESKRENKPITSSPDNCRGLHLLKLYSFSCDAIVVLAKDRVVVS